MRDIESLVYTRIVDNFSSTLQTKYDMSDDNFSTSIDNVDAIFPYIYIHALPSAEQDNTLENDTIESYMATIRIDVADNEDSDRVSRIMSECIKIMKSMRFTVTSIPEFSYSDNKIRQIGQFRRLIGENDNL